jgi:hypothetical protein
MIGSNTTGCSPREQVNTPCFHENVKRGSQFSSQRKTMSQTLLSRSERAARSVMLKKEIMRLLADGKPKDINTVLAEAAAPCGLISDDVAPVLSNMIYKKELTVDFLVNTVRV